MVLGYEYDIRTDQNKTRNKLKNKDIEELLSPRLN